jgi:hypothetical protein
MHKPQITSHFLPLITFSHTSDYSAFFISSLNPILGKAYLSSPSCLLSTSSMKVHFAKFIISVISILGSGQNDLGVVTERIKLT